MLKINYHHYTYLNFNPMSREYVTHPTILNLDICMHTGFIKKLLRRNCCVSFWSLRLFILYEYVCVFIVYTFFTQDDDDDGTSRPDRQDDKRIFFDDIFGSVSYEPEEKLPVSNCTCSEYLHNMYNNLILPADYIISYCILILT